MGIFSALGHLSGLNPNNWLTKAIGGTDSGLSSALGGIWNNISGAQGMANFNAKEAQKNRDWQEYMSNTAMQRQMEDIKAAGLNPTLMMGSGGGGASVPNGTAASGTQSGANPIGAITSAISDIGLLASHKRNIDADSNLKENTAGKTQIEMNGIEIDNKYKDARNQLQLMLMSTNNDKAKAEINKVLSETSKIQKEISKMDDEIAILKAEGKIKEAETKTKTRNRRAYATLEMIESGTRSIGNIVGAVKGTSALPTTGNFNSNSVSWIR